MRDTLSNVYSKTKSEFNSVFLTNPGESVFEAARRFHLFDFGEIKFRNKTLPLHDKQYQPQKIKVTGEAEFVPEEVKRICKVFYNLNYQVFRDDQKNYNLNIVGIRNDNSEPNKFDDEICVFWRFNNKWTVKKYKATTDPGLTFLQNPISDAGTAILKEGQYLKAYRLGKHKGLYDALVQCAPVTVIRDFNRDNKLDFSSGKEHSGLFGINVHHASLEGESFSVNKWSAGCQVFARISEYNEFISLCKKAVTEWGNEFSYSLINKRNLS